MPYYVDANSMHWVSKFELINFFKNKNFKTFSIRVNSKVLLSKDWFVKKLLTVAIMIKKRDTRFKKNNFNYSKVI